MITATGIDCEADPLPFNSMNTNCGKIEREQSRQYYLSLSLLLSLSIILLWKHSFKACFFMQFLLSQSETT